ncbi:Fur family transcriptional regulator [Chengkuizengella sp. SCS-71B]|uniref:Fur family transcriptional regulator n=1 Tax=Chengkuizengella sp. SCS-71B TaxID=3115290 RepID=UPI0032C23B32
MLTIDQVLKMLSEQGFRITEQRKSLIELFVENGSYLTAKDVYKYMSNQYSGLSFDTVYRNLRLMKEVGVIEQFVFEDGIKFKIRCAEESHHHHLICLECEKTYSIHYCPVQYVPELPDQFQIVNHKFELYGFCKDCQN